MQDLEKSLLKLNGYINEYHTMKTLDGHRLSELLQKISSLLYYLETVRSDVNNEFESEIGRLIDEGHSVARATNLANTKYPQMYKLRCIMRGAYGVVEAIRSNISYLKHEINQN